MHYVKKTRNKNGRKGTYLTKEKQRCEKEENFKRKKIITGTLRKEKEHGEEEK